MRKRNQSPVEIEQKTKIRELLEMSNIASMEDIQTLFKETVAEFMENGLNTELNEDLSYNKYDYKNKHTDNCRNGYSKKFLRTNFGNVDVTVSRDRNGQFEPQLKKKDQTIVRQNIEEKILSMYANRSEKTRALNLGPLYLTVCATRVWKIFSSKCVSYKDMKTLISDLKAVYATVDEASVLENMELFSWHWDKKYPKILLSWRDN